MKQSQSGFAVVGAAFVMVAVLAGTAFIFRNAGTPDDMVAQVSKAVTGRSGQPSGLGSGVSGTQVCPADCMRLNQQAIEYSRRYAELGDLYRKGNCHRLIQGSISYGSGCTNLKRQMDEVSTGGKKIDQAYKKCVEKNNAAKVCPVLGPSPYAGLDVDCSQSARDLGAKKKTLESRARANAACYNARPPRNCEKGVAAEGDAYWKYQDALDGYNRACPFSRKYPAAYEVVSNATAGR